MVRNWLILAFIAIGLLAGCTDGKPELTDLKDVNFIGNNSFSVSINQRASQTDPAATSTVEFDVVFSDPIDITSLYVSNWSDASDDIEVSGSSSGYSWSITNPSADLKNFILTATGASSGTIQVSMLANKVSKLSMPTVGNTASSSNDNSVLVDTVLPTTTIGVSDTSPSNDTSLTISGSCGDTHSGLSSGLVYICVKANSTCTASDYLDTATCSAGSYSFTFSPATHTIYDFSVKTYDNAGNASPLIYVSNFVSDLTKPTASCTNAAYSTNGDIAPSVSCDDNIGSGGSGCGALSECRIDGGAWGTCSFSSVSDGAHTIQTRVDDLAGNISTTYGTCNVTVDTQSPVVTITSPANNSSQQASMTISGACETGLNVVVSGGATGGPLACAASAYSGSITLTGPDATRTVTVTQTDAAGNSGSASRDFVRDTAGPTVTINQAGGQADPANAVPVQFTVVFSEAINAASFTAADISHGGTATVSTWTITDSGDHITFTVAATAISADGTIIPSIAASTVTDIAGNSNAASTSTDHTVTYTTGPLSLTVVPVYGTNIGDADTNWNDYIRFNNSPGGTNPYDQNIEPCTGTEIGYYGELNGCIHSGEKRKVVVTGYNSCTNLTITDTLGVFDWICVSNASTGNIATFFTKSLAAGKGLRNLLSASGSWLSNAVDVKLSGTTIGISTAAAWWTNPTQDLSAAPFDNSASASVINLNTAGTIYFVATSSRTTFGYQIAADKISVVTLGATQLKKFDSSNLNNCNTTTGTTATPNTHAVLCGGSKYFIWIEANIDAFTSAAFPAYTGVFAYNWKHSRIHQTTISPTHSNNAFYAFSLNSSSYNMLTGLEIYDTASGAEFSGSTYNIVKGLRVGYARYNNANCKSLNVATGSNFNRFYDTVVTNHYSPHASSKAVYLAGANNIFSRTNISNINGQGEGLYLHTTAANNIISQTITTAAQDAGVYFNGGASSNIISHLVSANNVYNGVYFNSGGACSNNTLISAVMGNSDKALQVNAAGSGSGNKFVDLYIANNTTYGSEIPAFTFGTVQSYLIVGNNGTSNCVGNTDLCTLTTPITSGNLSTAFVGKVITNDSQNTSDTNGYAATLSTLAGWFNFDNWLRGWGKDGSFPGAGIMGFASSTYRIWDWRAASGDNLHNRSFDGSFNGTLNTDSTTCSAGTVSATDTITASSLTFLRNAIEIDADGVGNDNAICEANEDCFWAPNIGVYQGSGSLSSGYCSVGDGAGPGIDGIRIFKYLTN